MMWERTPKDMNGKRMRIGDRVHNGVRSHVICGFGTISGRDVVIYLSATGNFPSGWDFADTVEVEHV